ncbi:glycosyl transferases group 1 family protein [Clostridium botulinum]|nr:glycosyltransferase [Clostridium botulinum]APH22623.1 glycosyl transferases group 1 family protein [Clostridium botulinum]APQ69254.1 glycosyl transferases group 1 family protein [Clostridium botulinum]
MIYWKLRKKGFNIAYVGYINFKKGPMLLLHAFKKIFDTDNRYKLHIAGTFDEERYRLYFNQMIKEFGMEKNVIFYGWQKDINKWLEDKNYLICTSVLES